MSFAVMRGSPEEAQLYLDRVIDDVIKDGGSYSKDREDVSLTEILLYCLRKNPQNIHTINGATGEDFTNQQILKRAVSIARAITAISGNETDRTVIIMVRNHEHMAALYYAVLLAGVTPFMMEPGSTEHELQHFLSLVNPCLIFCEPGRCDDITSLVHKSDVSIDVVAADGPSLDEFVAGHSDNVESYQLPRLYPSSSAILLPTSGSTGLPKAAIMTHQGLTAQLPCTWMHYTKFPQPTRLVLLISTGQWMTHTILMTTCPVYQVPVLVSPEIVSAKHVAFLVEKYRPTWALAGPALAAALGHTATAAQLSSLEALYMGGSPFAPESMAALKEKLSPSALLSNVYGLTETQGFVSLSMFGNPLTSVGKVLNILEYKIVNTNGETISEPFEKGEIYLKGKCILKGYLKDEAAYNSTVTSDGWLKTGDIFYSDEDGKLFFANRNKLGFKYLNHHVYPEEVERVIDTLPGVQQCVVCGTDAGPAAAVILLPGSDVTREDINDVVNSTLSDYKRLRGGIAFVTSLPRTHTGKVKRDECQQLIQELVVKGECF